MGIRKIWSLNKAMTEGKAALHGIALCGLTECACAALQRKKAPSLFGEGERMKRRRGITFYPMPDVLDTTFQTMR